MYISEVTFLSFRHSRMEAKIRNSNLKLYDPHAVKITGSIKEAGFLVSGLWRGNTVPPLASVVLPTRKLSCFCGDKTHLQLFCLVTKLFMHCFQIDSKCSIAIEFWVDCPKSISLHGDNYKNHFIPDCHYLPFSIFLYCVNDAPFLLNYFFRSLLNCVSNSKEVQIHWFHLADSMNSIYSLLFYKRIPPLV